MGENREVKVYVPADYNQAIAYNLVIQFDGQNYSANPKQAPIWKGWTPLPTIIDNLIYKQKIGPTIVVFISNQGNRTEDLISEKMTDFRALEVLPSVKENYNINTDPKRVVVSGPSRAGFSVFMNTLPSALILIRSLPPPVSKFTEVATELVVLNLIVPALNCIPETWSS